MEDGKVVKTSCTLCMAGCGMLVHIRDGKPVSIEGDPENPVNRGVLCVKGLASLEYLNSPQRLKYPMKRAGQKGEGKWQRISWDEALDTVAGKMAAVKEKFGARSVAFVRGGAKGYPDSFLSRFANVFGSPNMVATSNICYIPRMHASRITYGFMSTPDYDYPPACILMWALNTSATAIGDYVRLQEARKNGSRLIVIDPTETEPAKRSDIWVKPRPCTDLALALGMMNVIINENLYDKEFVDKWTSGFEKLSGHVQSYPPAKVAEITGVPADTIRQIARIYATSKPACLAWGNGIDNNVNSFPAARALAILRTITGNIGRPGGDIQFSEPAVVSKVSPELLQQNALPAEVRAQRISADKGLLPTIFFVLPQDFLAAVISGKPYPIKAAFLPGAALLHSYSDSQETYRALKNLDFMAASDFFMTPTMEMADIVLPAATHLEMDFIQENSEMHVVSVIRKVAEIGECWSDLKVYNGLAKRLGMQDYFWEDEHQVLGDILRPAGLSFEELKKVGFFPGIKKYRAHEQKGFDTPSHKVELFSSLLEKWGFDPMPVYSEPPESPMSDAALAKDYPLVLTSAKLAPYIESSGRQIPSLRDSHPNPLVVIHKDTAASLGINEGDWVYIENRRGKIRHKASLSASINPGTVILEHGWWFPEKKDSELHGWAESNLNILTTSKPPYNREVGSTTLRGILCKVYKAE